MPSRLVLSRCPMRSVAARNGPFIYLSKSVRFLPGIERLKWIYLVPPIILASLCWESAAAINGGLAVAIVVINSCQAAHATLILDAALLLPGCVNSTPAADIGAQGSRRRLAF